MVYVVARWSVLLRVLALKPSAGQRTTLLMDDGLAKARYGQKRANVPSLTGSPCAYAYYILQTIISILPATISADLFKLRLLFLLDGAVSITKTSSSFC